MGVIMMNSLLGSGDVAVVLRTSLLFQWLIFFPIAVLSVFLLNPSFLAIWVLFIASRLGQGLIYLHNWHSDKWGSAKL
jgi:Na+-driven multidrug efflux pump